MRINPEEFQAGVDAKLAAAFDELTATMRATTVMIKAARSFSEHRAGNEAAARATLADLTQDERDTVHAWARWLIGDESE